MIDFTRHLSSGVGRKDQLPNKELADKIVRNMDPGLLEQLIMFYQTRPGEKLENDIVMVLKEVSCSRPDLLSRYIPRFFDILKSSSNQQVWGAMTILSRLVQIDPDSIYDKLELIVDSMEKGSVITRDHGFSIMCHLYSIDEYRSTIHPLINEELLKSPDNQAGQYAEKFLHVVLTQHIDEMERILESRMSDLNNEYHIRRLEKVLRKIRKKN